MCQGWLRTVSSLELSANRGGESLEYWLRPSLKSTDASWQSLVDGSQLAKSAQVVATNGAKLICRFVQYFA